jgi:hypothetical protein
MVPISKDLADKVRIVEPKARKRGKIVNSFIPLEGLETLCQGDEILLDCLKVMVTDCLRYAETVCRFEQVVAAGQTSNENGAREEIEKIRTGIHDSTITSINALSRALRRAGRDNQWISKVSVDKRASYGKFALLVAFEAVLQPQKGGKDANNG